MWYFERLIMKLRRMFQGGKFCDKGLARLWILYQIALSVTIYTVACPSKNNFNKRFIKLLVDQGARARVSEAFADLKEKVSERKKLSKDIVLERAKPSGKRRTKQNKKIEQEIDIKSAGERIHEQSFYENHDWTHVGRAVGTGEFADKSNCLERNCERRLRANVFRRTRP